MALPTLEAGSEPGSRRRAACRACLQALVWFGRVGTTQSVVIVQQ